MASESAISPAAVRCIRDVLKLDTSTWSGKEYWMHVGHDGKVFIYKHRPGEEATEHIEIPRATFGRMVDWYLKEQD